jgi:hypothetical protein
MITKLLALDGITCLTAPTGGGASGLIGDNRIVVRCKVRPWSVPDTATKTVVIAGPDATRPANGQVANDRVIDQSDRGGLN